MTTTKTSSKQFTV